LVSALTNASGLVPGDLGCMMVLQSREQGQGLRYGRGVAALLPRHRSESLKDFAEG